MRVNAGDSDADADPAATPSRPRSWRIELAAALVGVLAGLALVLWILA